MYICKYIYIQYAKSSEHIFSIILLFVENRIFVLSQKYEDEPVVKCQLYSEAISYRKTLQGLDVDPPIYWSDNWNGGGGEGRNFEQACQTSEKLTLASPLQTVVRPIFPHWHCQTFP